MQISISVSEPHHLNKRGNEMSSKQEMCCMTIYSAVIPSDCHKYHMIERECACVCVRMRALGGGGVNAVTAKPRNLEICNLVYTLRETWGCAPRAYSYVSFTSLLFTGKNLFHLGLK
jgi:hypothetical protein